MERRTRIPSRWLTVTLVAVLAAAVLVPAAALAAGGSFSDDDTSIFEADIEWLAGSGVTRGCNPPANDRFCPEQNVTRGQMAAFMRRFAQFLGAEDGVVNEADTAAFAVKAEVADVAADADRLAGLGPDHYRQWNGRLVLGASAFGLDGYSPSARFDSGELRSLTDDLACAIAPVDLPVGSTIRALTVWGRHSLNPSVFSASIDGRGWASPSHFDVAYALTPVRDTREFASQHTEEIVDGVVAPEASYHTTICVNGGSRVYAIEILYDPPTVP